MLFSTFTAMFAIPLGRNVGEVTKMLYQIEFDAIDSMLYSKMPVLRTPSKVHPVPAPILLYLSRYRILALALRRYPS